MTGGDDDAPAPRVPAEGEAVARLVDALVSRLAPRVVALVREELERRRAGQEASGGGEVLPEGEAPDAASLPAVPPQAVPDDDGVGPEVE